MPEYQRNTTLQAPDPAVAPVVWVARDGRWRVVHTADDPATTAPRVIVVRSATTRANRS